MNGRAISEADDVGIDEILFRPYARHGILVLDVELAREQLAALDALDTGTRGGPEPDSITLETYGKAIPEA